MGLFRLDYILLLNSILRASLVFYSFCPSDLIVLVNRIQLLMIKSGSKAGGILEKTRLWYWEISMMILEVLSHLPATSASFFMPDNG